MASKDSFIQQPTGMYFTDADSIIQFQWHWRRLGIIPIVVFALFISLFLLIAFASEVNSIWDLRYIIVFPPAWFGFGIIYSALALCFNSTKVTVDADHLVVTHGPLPWPGRTYVERHAILQLNRSRITYEFGAGKRIPLGSLLYPYQLYALCGRPGYVYPKKVLKGLPTSIYCLFIKSKIESFWGIKDSYPS